MHGGQAGVLCVFEQREARKTLLLILYDLVASTLLFSFASASARPPYLHDPSFKNSICISALDIVNNTQSPPSV
jgi:hypothetical protein